MNATLQHVGLSENQAELNGESGAFSTGGLFSIGRRKRRALSRNISPPSRVQFLHCSFEQLEPRNPLAIDVSLPGTVFNVNEGNALGFTATAVESGPVTPTQPYTFSLLGAPAGASIDAATGVFSWTPGETAGGGVFTFDVVVTDSSAVPQSGSETVTVNVAEVNTAPELALISNLTVNEMTLARFTATATDANSPANALAFSLVGAPTGGSINATTGVFSWTPTEAQGPASYTFEVVVTDNGTPALNDRQFVTITVNEANRPPNLAPQAARTVNEGATLTVTFTATDPDLPSQARTFSLVGAPAGAGIDPTTGVFSWTPTEAQGGTSYTFGVRATDSLGLFDQENFTVTVNELNLPPTLAPIGNKTVDEGTTLTFTVTANDPDLPSQALTFSLAGAPSGAAINATSGVFSWTPAEADGPGSYTFDVVVTDSGNPALTARETITVTVNEVNAAPVLDAVGNRSVNEGAALSFTATASDADVPANTLAFSLVGAPVGATINPATGAFSWTTGEVDGPGVYTFDVVVTDGGGLSDSETITVTVNEVNVAPVLGAIGNRTVDESTTLSFAATASDADVPANSLVFSLVGAPAGATIVAATGVFSWTPSEAQGPGVYTFDVVVTDGGGLSDSETITVTVNETNATPVLGAIGDRSVDEGGTLSFTATASDADLPPNPLTFSLVGAPAGATIHATTGVFSWSPSEAQGPGVYTFDVVVTDGGGASDSETITVTVNEANISPVLAAIGNRVVFQGETVMFTASATDADEPADTLVFSLVGAPAGAAIDAETGAFFWAANVPGGAYSFEVVVTDSGDPALSDRERVTIVVNEVNTQLDLTVSGPTSGVRGQPLVFTFTVAGASAGNVSYAIDWNSDGTVDQTVVGGASVKVEHVYRSTGSYTISATATDSSGRNSAAATHGVSIAKWSVQNDATGARTLVVGGTEWSDMIEMKPSHRWDSVRLNLNYQSFEVVVRGSSVVPITRVIVYGQAGDDWVKISTKWDMPTLAAELHGGPGNDKLRGGSGDDLILGGPGDDLLVGHRGRDFLIGGAGRDRIVGNEHDDILISGFSSYDANVVALDSIFKEWKSSRSYNERVANLRGTGTGAAFASRLNANNFFVTEGAAMNVFDDGVRDYLAGDGGMDWYFANLSLDGNDDAQKKDRLVGLDCEEFAMDLDFILNDE
jgi:hypothetical protein